MVKLCLHFNLFLKAFTFCSLHFIYTLFLLNNLTRSNLVGHPEISHGRKTASKFVGPFLSFRVNPFAFPCSCS